MVTNKNCTVCKIDKPIDQYAKRRVGKNNYSFGFCKDCRNTKKREQRVRRGGPTESERRRNRRSKDQEILMRLDPAHHHTIICKDSKNNDRIKKRKGNDLTPEFVREKIDQGCIYCGNHEVRMTLDRIDPDLGHLQSNVVPACYRCNIVRGDMPYAAWLLVAPAIKQAQEAGLLGNWKTVPISRCAAKDNAASLSMALPHPSLSVPRGQLSGYDLYLTFNDDGINVGVWGPCQGEVNPVPPKACWNYWRK